MLLVADSMFHFLVRILQFIDFSSELRTAISSLIRFLGSTRRFIGFLPTEVLLQGTIGFILLAIQSVMGGMCTPMFLANGAMLLPVMLLGNPFINRNHLLLGGVS